MAEKTNILKADTVVKNYWRDNERFADFFNAVLFDGEEVIKAEELEDVDTEESMVLEHKDYAESIQAARDGIKIRKRSLTHGVELVMLGMEGQGHIHYGMPLRVMGYDYSTYKKQYDGNASRYGSGKHRASEGMDEDEYLSRMKRTDKFIPVITVVVYYGDKPWDGAASLHGMLNIPEGMKKFVNDYKMLLVEAGRNQLALHNMNNVDLFHLLQIVLDNNLPKNEAKEKAIKYCEDHAVEKSVVMTVAGAAGSNIDYNAFEREGGSIMCTLFDSIAKESEVKGRAEGIAEGRKEGIAEGRAEEIIESGYEFGLSDSDIIKRLQSRLDISLQRAQEYFGRFGRQKL